MTSEQFRAALRAQPFRPFTIRTADDRSYRVDHPELALLSRTGRTVVVEADGDAFVILDLLLVTAIEVAATAAGR